MDEIVKMMLVEDDVEVFLNNSLSSSEDEDINSAMLLLGEHKQARTTIKNYESVIEEYSEEEFIAHFLMSRQKVAEVTNKFAISDVYVNLFKDGRTRAKITPEKHILVFLWFAGHQTASFRDVSDRSDLCLSSLHDVVSRVSTFLSFLAEEVITLPTEARKEKTMEFYFIKKAIPNVIGSIDGTHVKIDKPTERSIDYFNRKDYYSMILQGVCDHELNFIDIFIGYPGSVHDARVFRNSSFFNGLETLCDGCYMLGDSAYPLLPQLLTPYRDNGHLTNAQKFFNKSLSSCRVSIEHAFGLLKQRFRQLYHIKLRGHERICHFIRACCVLHNIANKDDRIIFSNEEQVIDVQPEHATARDGQTGGDVRDEICRQLYLRRNNN